MTDLDDESEEDTQVEDLEKRVLPAHRKKRRIGCTCCMCGKLREDEVARKPKLYRTMLVWFVGS